MRFQVHFIREVGASPSIAELGDDQDPEYGDGGPDASKDNVLSTKVGGIGNTIHRVAVGYRYEGSGTPAELSAKLWAFDRMSDQWYLASTGTLKDGEITYFRIPTLADPPQVSANLGAPTAGGGEYMLVVATTTTDDGFYHFVMGPDLAHF